MYVSTIPLEGHTSNWSLVAPREENTLSSDGKCTFLFHMHFVMSTSVTDTVVALPTKKQVKQKQQSKQQRKRI